LCLCCACVAEFDFLGEFVVYVVGGGADYFAVSDLYLCGVVCEYL